MRARYVAVTVLFLVFCARPSAGDPPEAGSALTYRLRTDWEGATLRDGARVFENTLGDTITIRDLRIGVGALELVPCATASLLGPSVARADHYWGEDTSRLDALVADTLMREDAFDVGSATASGSFYCEAFWTIEAFEGLARDGVPLLGNAIQLEGSVRRGDEAPRELSIALRLGDGAVLPLEGEWTQGAIEIVRFPTRSFDVDFAELSDAEIGYEVLRNLGRTSEAYAR